MDSFVYYLLDGLCTGAVLALIALGYTLVYGIIKLINFAHGEFMMVGAYVAFGCAALAGRALSGLPPDAVPPGVVLLVLLPLLLLIGGVSGSAVAIATERIAYRPIRHSGRLVALLTAIGVSLTLQNLFKFIRGGNNLTFGEPLRGFFQQSVVIGSFGMPVVKFGFIGLVAVLMVALWYLVMRTRFGRSMRAVSQDLEAARLMGIDVDRVIMLTFALGGFFAGVAGFLQGALYQVNPMMGFMPGLIAFVAAVIGGIGNIPGAVLGGFLIGILQNLVVWVPLWPAGAGRPWHRLPTEYQDVVVFLLLILTLVVRPQGILGREMREKV